MAPTLILQACLQESVQTVLCALVLPCLIGPKGDIINEKYLFVLQYKRGENNAQQG